MDIRQYRPGDNERVIELNRTVMQAIGLYIDTGHTHDDYNNIEGIYLNNHGEFLVGIEDGRIIATGGFRPYSDGIAEVKRMRVDTGYQRKGYGRAILEALEKSARAMNYTGFILETSVIQTAARHLYKNLGFIEAGRETILGYDCIVFRKDFPRD
ncbi:MAG: GNAT family N-acetyltransferase [Brevinematales bacterium]|nr:GNAT family N-acetyltransferase [Brevinematales bacterium]